MNVLCFYTSYRVKGIWSLVGIQWLLADSRVLCFWYKFTLVSCCCKQLCSKCRSWKPACSKQHLLLLLLLPGLPVSIISHPYCLGRFRPSLSSVYHLSLLTGFSAYGVPRRTATDSSKASASRELFKPQLQWRPSLSSKPSMAHVAQGYHRHVLAGHLMGSVGCTSTLPHPPLPVHLLPFPTSVCYSTHMVRIEARIQVLITAFLVSLTALHPTR